jgi:phosphoglycolate phosphatase
LNKPESILKVPFGKVIFDLDGTLIDSAYQISDILNGMRCERSLGPLPLENFRHSISKGAEKLVQLTLNIEPSLVPIALREFRKRYTEQETREEYLYPDVRFTLDWLHQKSVEMSLCSNKPEDLCLKILQDLHLKDYFENVVGGDSTYFSKPHPKPLLAALGSYLPTDAVLVGDSTVDQRTAYASGIPFVFFTGGYDDGVDLTACFKVITSIGQLTTDVFN